MGQPPVAQFHEDRETRLSHRRSGRRSYLVAIPIVAAVAVVAIFGATGPKPAPARTPVPSPSAMPARSLGKPSPTSLGLWTPEPRPTAGAAIFGLTNVALDQSQVITEGFAGGAIPLDADGDQFLYAIGSDLFISQGAGISESRYKVATLQPCGALAQAAIAGGEVIYSEFDPIDYDAGGSTCYPIGLGATWRVSIASPFNGGHAAATGPASVNLDGKGGDAPLVGISDNAYAFSRPVSGSKLSVVEVHSLADDGLLFASEPLASPLQIHLADNRLVVAEPDQHDLAMTVLSTSLGQAPLRSVAGSNGSIALSRDGTRLAYEKCSQLFVCSLMVDGDPGSTVSLPTAATAVTVDGGSSGTLETVAWIAQAVNPTAYLALICATCHGPVALTGTDTPIWLHVQDDVLTWYCYSSDGTATLSRLDLTTAFPAP